MRRSAESVRLKTFVYISLVVIAGIVMLIAVRWACAADRRNRETFVASVAKMSSATGATMNAIGDIVTSDACLVDTSSGETVPLLDNPYFGKHPEFTNACVVKGNDYELDVLDAKMSQCVAATDYMSNATTVDRVAVEKVNGVDACVVRLKPGKQSADYASFATDARNKIMARTPEYTKFKRGFYDPLLAKYNALRLVVDGLEAELASWNKQDEAARAERAEVDKAAAAASTQKQVLTVERDDLLRRIQAQTDENASLKSRKTQREAEASKPAVQPPPPIPRQPAAQAAGAAAASPSSPNVSGTYRTFFNARPDSYLAPGVIKMTQGGTGGTISNGDGSLRTMQVSPDGKIVVPEWRVTGRFNGKDTIKWDNGSTWTTAAPAFVAAGCWRDRNTGDNANPTDRRTMTYIGQASTISECAANVARKGSSFPFFALQARSYCYAGNKGEHTALGPSTACGMSCLQNGGDCGGAYTNAVYKFSG